MEFDDVIFLIQTGTGLAAIATGNPALAAFGELGARLLQSGKKAYDSGKARGEWTAAQEKEFDEVYLPKLMSQPHWQKR